MNNKTIFICIASYKDKETANTIISAVENAKHPANLSFGVCYQYDDEIDLTELLENKKLKELVKKYACKIYVHPKHTSETRGMGWARDIAANEYRTNSDYLLQIDAHMRFRNNWDEILLAQYEIARTEAKTNRVIISASCFDFHEAEQRNISIEELCLEKTPRELIVPDYDDIHKTYTTSKNGNVIKDKPKKVETISGHFLFTIYNFLDDVPYDPEIYWNGEEISLAIRAWTNGYELYSPSEIILLHETVGYLEKLNKKDKRSFHYIDYPDRFGLFDSNSKKRINRLLGINEPDLEKPYGLGEKRSRDDFYKYLGKRLNKFTNDSQLYR